MAMTACGSEGGSIPILQQSNVHFEGCPSTPAAADSTCRATATVHNSGGAGTARQVFYYSLRTGSTKQQQTCTPDIPAIPPGGTVELTCDITIPAGAVPTDLVLSGR